MRVRIHYTAMSMYTCTVHKTEVLEEKNRREKQRGWFLQSTRKQYQNIFIPARVMWQKNDKQLSIFSEAEKVGKFQKESIHPKNNIEFYREKITRFQKWMRCKGPTERSPMLFKIHNHGIYFIISLFTTFKQMNELRRQSPPPHFAVSKRQCLISYRIS